MSKKFNIEWIREQVEHGIYEQVGVEWPRSQHGRYRLIQDLHPEERGRFKALLAENPERDERLQLLVDTEQGVLMLVLLTGHPAGQLPLSTANGEANQEDELGLAKVTIAERKKMANAVNQTVDGISARKLTYLDDIINNLPEGADPNGFLKAFRFASDEGQDLDTGDGLISTKGLENVPLRIPCRGKSTLTCTVEGFGSEGARGSLELRLSSLDEASSTVRGGVRENQKLTVELGESSDPELLRQCLFAFVQGQEVQLEFLISYERKTGKYLMQPTEVLNWRRIVEQQQPIH